MAEGPRRRWGWEESRCNVRSGCPFFSVVDVEAEILEVLEFFCVLEDVFVTGRSLKVMLTIDKLFVYL